jgi:hypothetical protein
MSFRNNLAASSALMLVSLCGASSFVSAADTQSIVRETCTQTTLVEFRQVGHPGKSLLLPKRPAREGVQCSREQRKPMMLASFTDARGGQALVAGQAQQALDQIHARNSKRFSAFELNNQCVAYTVLRQWTQAGDACDAAVDSALDKREKNSKLFGGPRYPVASGIATAYSNRAVMHWLSNNAAAAQNDLAKARKLAPQASYIRRNLGVTALESSLASAQGKHAPTG